MFAHPRPDLRNQIKQLRLASRCRFFRNRVTRGCVFQSEIESDLTSVPIAYHGIGAGRYVIRIEIRAQTRQRFPRSIGQAPRNIATGARNLFARNHPQPPIRREFCPQHLSQRGRKPSFVRPISKILEAEHSHRRPSFHLQIPYPAQRREKSAPDAGIQTYPAEPACRHASEEGNFPVLLSEKTAWSVEITGRDPRRTARRSAASSRGVW